MDDKRFFTHRRRPTAGGTRCRYPAACMEPQISEVFDEHQKTKAIERPPSPNPQKRKCTHRFNNRSHVSTVARYQSALIAKQSHDNIIAIFWKPIYIPGHVNSQIRNLEALLHLQEHLAVVPAVMRPASVPTAGRPVTRRRLT